MTRLQKIEIDSNEDFVLKIKDGCFEAEVLIRVNKLEYSLMNGLQEISLLVLNPDNTSMKYTSTTNA
jgi:hypothetical protein